MDNNQSVQPAAQNTNLINKAAKLAFSDFLKQMPNPQSKGFIGEGEDNHQKIFSFETYLSEVGISVDLIYKYCTYIKSDRAQQAAEKKPTLYNLTDYRFLVKAIPISMIPGIILYLLITAFFWTFEMTFFKWVPFTLFAFSYTLIMTLSWIIQYMRLKRNERSGIVQTEYIIKCFDNDELTYLKNKSKLFVEK